MCAFGRAWAAERERGDDAGREQQLAKEGRRGGESGAKEVSDKLRRLFGLGGWVWGGGGPTGGGAIIWLAPPGLFQDRKGRKKGQRIDSTFSITRLTGRPARRRGVSFLNIERLVAPREIPVHAATWVFLPESEDVLAPQRGVAR